MNTAEKRYAALALITIAIWGTTFVSSKVLLAYMTPVQIMLSRYVIAYIALWIFYPKFHKPASLRQEILILGAALCGSTLYFLAENYAVSYTQASNVSLLLAAVPILTSITAHLAGDEKLTRNIVLGFLVAMAGICLVVFNGNFILKLNPLGDLLALGAAFSWVFYTLIIRNIHQEHSYLYMTRKIFFYSILTMLPCIAIDGKLVSFQVLRQPVVYLNLLFLGLIASSLCYVTWYIVVDKLGAVKANNFIYFNPLVTMIASVIVLHEVVTLYSILGAALILLGVYLAQKQSKTADVS